MAELSPPPPPLPPPAHAGAPAHGVSGNGDSPLAPDRGNTANDGTDAATRPPRPGELTSGWRLVSVVAWIAVVLAWSAVWNTSVQLGLATWWIGARADQTPLVVRLAPFAGPLVVILGALNNSRWLPWVGLGGSVVFGAYGVADLGRVTGLGVLEVLIAVAAAAVSAASLTGMYRRAEPAAPAGTDPA